VIVEQKTRLDRAAILDRIDVDLIAVPRDYAQRSFLTVDVHLPDLGMRHAQRFNQMLDGLLSAKG